jgi:hypothetical protein
MKTIRVDWFFNPDREVQTGRFQPHRRQERLDSQVARFMELLNAIDTVGLVGARDRVLVGRLGHNLRALAH